jgi:hypothetical protein
MEVSTTEPGLQSYTSYFLDNMKGKKGVIYRQFSAICLETQHYADSVNHVSFCYDASILLIYIRQKHKANPSTMVLVQCQIYCSSLMCACSSLMCVLCSVFVQVLCRR